MAVQVLPICSSGVSLDTSGTQDLQPSCCCPSGASQQGLCLPLELAAGMVPPITGPQKSHCTPRERVSCYYPHFTYGPYLFPAPVCTLSSQQPFFCPQHVHSEFICDFLLQLGALRLSCSIPARERREQWKTLAEHSASPSASLHLTPASWEQISLSSSPQRV